MTNIFDCFQVFALIGKFIWFWRHLHSHVHRIPTQIHPCRLTSLFYFFLTIQFFLYNSESLSKLFSLSPSFYPNSSYIILLCPTKRTQQYKLLLSLWLNNGNSTKDPFGKTSFYNSWSYMELISSSVTKAFPFLSLSLLFPVFRFIEWVFFNYVRKGKDLWERDFKSHILKNQSSLIEYWHLFYLILSHFSVLLSK